MRITPRRSDDVQTLTWLARREKDAGQRDRYLVVAHACRGVETSDIQTMLARSRGFVQRWVYAYRDGGIGCFSNARTDRACAPKLARQREADLKARLDVGPTDSDGVYTLRGKDVRRILEREFVVRHTLDVDCPLLHRLSYSCLAPRPGHEKQDRAAQKKFKEKTAPFLSTPSAPR